MEIKFSVRSDDGRLSVVDVKEQHEFGKLSTAKFTLFFGTMDDNFV